MPSTINQVVLPMVASETIFDDTVSPPTSKSGGGFVLGNGTELQVQAQGSPDMTVQIPNPGVAYNAQGDRMASGSVVSVAIAAADVTNPRADIVVIDLGGISQVRTGTPGNPANDPTLSNGDIVLARVNVAANATNVTGGNIQDLRSRRSIHGQKLLKNSVSTNELNTGVLQQVTINLNATQLNALATTPFQIIPQQGPNTVISFLGAGISYDWDGGTAYTIGGGDDLAFRYQDGSGNIVSQTIETTGFLDQTADKIRWANPLQTQDTLIVNQPIVLDNVGADFTAGTSPVHVTAWYRVWQTGL